MKMLYLLAIMGLSSSTMAQIPQEDCESFNDEYEVQSCIEGYTVIIDQPTAEIPSEELSDEHIKQLIILKKVLEQGTAL